MLDKLLLHTKTRKRLDSIASSPSQGYLFVGPVGSGKHTVAQSLASLWSNGDRGLIYTILPKGSSLGIEQIHNLKPLLSGRVQADQRRTIIMDQAEKLTREAQNSLLKILEEPAPRTTFILISGGSAQLLPTIRSRLFTVDFYRLASDELMDWFSAEAKLDRTTSQRYYHLGDYTPGGMKVAFFQNESGKDMIDLSKQFLTGDTYTRSLLVQTLHKRDRQELDKLLGVICKLLSFSMKSQLKQGLENNAQLLHTARKLRLTLKSRQLLGQNVNVRLILTQLVIEL